MELFQLPSGGDLWSYYFDFELRRMDTWEKIVPSFRYDKETPFFDMLVPTVDTVRFGYILEKLLSVRRSVLYTGSTGVGKVSLTITMASCYTSTYCLLTDYGREHFTRGYGCWQSKHNHHCGLLLHINMLFID